MNINTNKMKIYNVDQVDSIMKTLMNRIDKRFCDKKHVDQMNWKKSGRRGYRNKRW